MSQSRSASGENSREAEAGLPLERRVGWPQRLRATVLLYAVVLGVAFVLFALNACHAHYPSDDGWLLAYGWRILHGEVPYRDFWWGQPPVTLYTASLWLRFPEGWQFKAARSAYYLEMASVTLLPATWAIWTGRLRSNAPTLAVVGAGVALAFHNFPPMPWSTVDGLFFGSAGLGTFLASLSTATQKRVAWRGLSSLTLALAMFSKQGFAPLPVVLAAYSIFEFMHGRRLALLLASLLPAGTLTAFVLSWLYSQHALGAFIAALRSSGQGDALAGAALGAYLRPMPIGPLAYSGFAFLGFRLASLAVGRIPGESRVDHRFDLTFLGLCLSLAALGLAMNHPLVGFRIGVGVFFIGTGAAIRTTLDLRRRHGGDSAGLVLLLGALALCWGASISYGYQTPLLGIGLLGVALMSLLDITVSRWIATLAVACGLATFGATIFHNVQHPYHDRPRRELTANLGDIYPRFGTLLTNKDHYGMYADIKELSEVFATSRGKPFVVMPNFPLIHFLSNHVNPVQIDWFHPTVIGGRDQAVERRLASAHVVVLLVRNVNGQPSNLPHCENIQPTTEIEKMIAFNWHLLAESRYFCVFEDGH